MELQKQIQSAQVLPTPAQVDHPNQVPLPVQLVLPQTPTPALVDHPNQMPLLAHLVLPQILTPAQELQIQVLIPMELQKQVRSVLVLPTPVLVVHPRQIPLLALLVLHQTLSQAQVNLLLLQAPFLVSVQPYQILHLTRMEPHLQVL